MLSVQDEVVSLGSETDSSLLAEQDESEHVAVLCIPSALSPSKLTLSLVPAHLFPAVKEELVRVHAISDSAADEGHPVENDRRLLRVLNEKLLQDIQHDSKNDERGETGGDQDSRGGLRSAVCQGACDGT